MEYNVHHLYRNRYFDELKKYPAAQCQSHLFRHYTEDIPIRILPGERIAGRFGYDEMPPSEGDNNFPWIPVMSDEERTLRQRLMDERQQQIYFTYAHTCIDYGAVLEKGLIHWLARVNAELEKEPENDMLLGMKTALEAAGGFALRFAILAETMAQDADGEEKDRLIRIARACRRVPMYPARDFFEAVQSLWLMHSLIPMAEMSWASISVGRMDQYLYPYYRNAADDGISREEMKAILKNLFVLLDSYGDGACTLNIGGMDADGNDMTNGLSYLFLEVEKEMSLRAPIFAVRVHDGMPEDYLDSLIDFNLFRIGQPTFYGEIPCRAAVAGRGIDETAAADFSANSCMGLILPGREFADMWGVMVNMHLPLELALNHGKPLNGEMPFSMKTAPAEITSFEVLLTQYEEYLSEMMEKSAGLYRAAAQETAANLPDPLLSVLTEGCLGQRLDRAVGAEYNTVTVEAMGMINTCDALEAIRTLVFEQRKYTVGQILDAARRNYEGDEVLLTELRGCAKYGMNDAGCNDLCRRIGGMLNRACRREQRGNLYFLPSLHTIDVNVSYGKRLGATLDGRLAGEPVNKNANPSALLKESVHTAVIQSAAAVPQTDFSGGQPIDLYFDASWFRDGESRERIKSLIRTYFRLGGLQLQVNSIDIPLLEKAHEDPENYPWVIVRKGGYSVRFNELGPDARRDFIDSQKRAETCL